MSITVVWSDHPDSPVVVAEGRPFLDARESCQSCGYALEVHVPARAGRLDRDGGCPEDEVDALRRMGLL